MANGAEGAARHRCEVHRWGHGETPFARALKADHRSRQTEQRGAKHRLREAYVFVMKRALRKGGKAIMGTFAPDGPEKCSGLPVVRYDARTLHAVLGNDFRLVSTLTHQHETPWKTIQQFQFSTFEKVV